MLDYKKIVELGISGLYVLVIIFSVIFAYGLTNRMLSPIEKFRDILNIIEIDSWWVNMS
jgi:hypothetical protein